MIENYEQRIKIVRGLAFSTEMAWDTRGSEQYLNYNHGKNEWEGSLVQTYLNDNGDYYTRTGTASNFGLKSSVKNLISDAKYYLGVATYNNGYVTADAIYLFERGNETFSFEKYCSYYTWNNRCSIENYCENNPTDEICNATRSKLWLGKFALMYSSDQYLVYANGVDSGCYENLEKCVSGGTNFYETPSLGWLYNSNNLEWQSSPYYNWLISPFTNDSFNALMVNFNGNIGDVGSDSSNLMGVRPVLYLSPNVKITSGTVDENDPFKLEM